MQYRADRTTDAGARRKRLYVIFNPFHPVSPVYGFTPNFAVVILMDIVNIVNCNKRFRNHLSTEMRCI